MDFPAKMRERLVRQEKRAPRRLTRRVCYLLTHDKGYDCDDEDIKKLSERIAKWVGRSDDKWFKWKIDGKYSANYRRLLPHGFLYDDDELVVHQTTEKFRGHRQRRV